MKNAVIEGLATVMILAMVILGGYMYLKWEADKILDKSNQHRELTVVEKKSMLPKYPPKTFEQTVKTTENER